MTPHRKKIVGAIASAVAALTLLGGTAAAADAPRPSKQTQGGTAAGSTTPSNPISPKAWKPR